MPASKKKKGNSPRASSPSVSQCSSNQKKSNNAETSAPKSPTGKLDIPTEDLSVNADTSKTKISTAIAAKCSTKYPETGCEFDIELGVGSKAQVRVKITDYSDATENRTYEIHGRCGTSESDDTSASEVVDCCCSLESDSCGAQESTQDRNNEARGTMCICSKSEPHICICTTGQKSAIQKECCVIKSSPACPSRPLSPADTKCCTSGRECCGVSAPACPVRARSPCPTTDSKCCYSGREQCGVTAPACPGKPKSPCPTTDSKCCASGREHCGVTAPACPQRPKSPCPTTDCECCASHREHYEVSCEGKSIKFVCDRCGRVQVSVENEEDDPYIPKVSYGEDNAKMCCNKCGERKTTGENAENEANAGYEVSFHGNNVKFECDQCGRAQMSVKNTEVSRSCANKKAFCVKNPEVNSKIANASTQMSDCCSPCCSRKQ